VDDLDKWSTALKLWKEYNIDYGNYFNGDENNQLGASLDDLQIEMDQDDDEEGGNNFMKNKSRSDAPSKDQGPGRTPFQAAVANQKNKKVVDMNDNTDYQDMPLPTFYYPEEKAGGDLSGGDMDCMDMRPTDVLEGWMEKKKKKVFGTDWQRRYCRIDERTKSFMYGKSPSASHDISAGSSINLTMVNDIIKKDSRIVFLGVGDGVQEDDKSDSEGKNQGTLIERIVM
jgi:hypothetical protein